MNVLYLGRYKKRLDPVISLIKKLPAGVRVLELCFGDIYLADFCRRNGYPWTGFDINSHFVALAKKSGFDAQTLDLTTTTKFPHAGVCVMMGSLYHFHPRAEEMLRRMFQAADVVIISEPVINLSARRGVVGWLARKSADAGNGHEQFRYNKGSLISMLERSSVTVEFNIAETQDCGRDLIIKLVKK